jgi:hypothetical protein
MGQNKESTLTNKQSVAWKVFTAFVSDDEEISVTEDELLSYATDDLKLNLNELPAGMRDDLITILLGYMNLWTGWKYKGDFLAGKFTKTHYFERFQKYMCYKMKNTVQWVYAASVVKDLDDQQIKPVILNKPNNNTDVEFSPYAIEIQCPPDMLSTLVFSNIGDDLIMKQHRAAVWQDLSTTQLLNWPHVEVKFHTEDICFVRRQKTEFVRYLNFLPPESSKLRESKIENAENLHTSGRQKDCYSYVFLEEYMKVYMKTLKSTFKVSSSKFEEIQAILSQFLEDVRYIDVNDSIATDTVVLFRLSPVPFSRNKKMARKDDTEGKDERVAFCEILHPKIELVLFYFTAEQKDTPTLGFAYTDKIKISNRLNVILPDISYKCTYCKLDYKGRDSREMMLNHLKNNHKMEQHVRCTLCNKYFDVGNLAACRWKHKCHQYWSHVEKE